jgi:hypothetical protein
MVRQYSAYSGLIKTEAGVRGFYLQAYLAFFDLLPFFHGPYLAIPLGRYLAEDCADFHGATKCPGAAGRKFHGHRRVYSLVAKDSLGAVEIYVSRITGDN